MANIRLIKKRVNSIRNIRKITKALEMVAASKVQRAQNAAVSARPYAQKVFELIRNIDDKTFHPDIPLLRIPSKISNDLYILISTNRGLAGSLNTNLFRNLHEFLQGLGGINHFFISVGKKGRKFSSLEGTILADFSDYSPTISASPSIVKLVSDTFTQGKVDAVYLVYNDFVSALIQKPRIKKLLPLSLEEVFAEEFRNPFDLVGEKERTAFVQEEKVRYTFEPSKERVLKELLPFYLEVELSEAMIEAEASEHSARMVAMKTASDNASELSESLMLTYNKERQASITNEISDITTAYSSLVKDR